MRLVGTAAGHAQEVADLELGAGQRLAVDEIHDRPQQQVDEHDEAGGDRGIEWKAGAGEHADRGRAPQRGGGIEPAHAQAFAKDQAGAEKTDARHHLRGDPGRARFLGIELREHDESGGAERDQGVGAQARQPVAPLPLEADDRAQAERGREIESRFLGRHR